MSFYLELIRTFLLSGLVAAVAILGPLYLVYLFGRYVLGY